MKLEQWQWTSLVLCGFGLFKEFRPSEPYFVEYAVDFRNITAERIIHNVLPVTSFGSFISLLIFVMITDFLRYKPVIIFGAFTFVITWILAIWVYYDETTAEIVQILHSIAISADIAYFTYMYANVERSHYKQVTSYTHSAIHSGLFLSGLCGQILLSAHALEIDDLNYISLGGVSIAFILALCLPKVKRSIYFFPAARRVSIVSSMNGQNNNGFKARKKALDEATRHVGFVKRAKRALPVYWNDFKKAYSNRYVLKWSIWWSLAFAVYLQVGIYSEPLWKNIEEESHQSVYNGAVDATHALLSAILTILVPLYRNWLKWGEVYLSLISFLQAEVAEGVNEDSEAFIFGLNTLLALTIQTILQIIIPSEYGLDLGIREEFLVYGSYCFALGLIFFVIAIQNRNKNWDLPIPEISIANTKATPLGDVTVIGLP